MNLLPELEFKKAIQDRIKTNLIPIFRSYGLKKGRANHYVRHRNGVFQYIWINLKEHSVSIYASMSPIYYPILDGIAVLSLSSDNALNTLEDGVLSKITQYTKNTPTTVPRYQFGDIQHVQWKNCEKIIIEEVLPSLDKIQTLDELMASSLNPGFTKPPPNSWQGITLYVEGIHCCLSGNFDSGIRKLKDAQSFKQEYVDHCALSGMKFGEKRDYLALVFIFVDRVCDGIAGDVKNKEEVFKVIYTQICEETKKIHKF